MRERDRTLSIQKKKLLKATTFSVVLLSVAIMVLGGAVSAINLNVNSTQMNVNSNTPNQPLNVQDSSANTAGGFNNGQPTMNTVLEKQKEFSGDTRGVVVYDNTMNYYTLTSNQADSVYGIDSEGADDFSFYTGGEEVCIQDVHWVGGHWNGLWSDAQWIIRFYEDDGTGNTPGALYAGPFTVTPKKTLLVDYTTESFWSFSADIPEVCFPGCGEKFWIDIQADHDYPPQYGWAAHYSPILGHELMWKCPYFGYPDWVPGSDVFGIVLDYAFQLTQKADHDVSVIEINTGEFCTCLPIEVVVTNYGKYDETNVPVHVQVSQQYAFWDEFYFDWTYNTANFWEAFYITEGVTPHSMYYMYEFKANAGTYYANEFDTWDLSNACNPMVTFWMWHDNLGSNDYIQVTANGVAVGPQFYRSGTTGWTQHQVAIPTSTTTIGFKGVADSIYAAYPIFIDDVALVDMALDETQYVDIDVGKEVTVDFSYCPCQMGVLEDTTLDLDITACTEMAIDQVPANNCLATTVSLYLPFFDDVAAVGMTLTDQGCLDYSVCGKIANLGQNQECCFKVYADIGAFNIGPWSYLYSDTFEYGYPLPPGWARDTTYTNWQYGYSYYPLYYYSYDLMFSWTPSVVADQRAYKTTPINTAGLYELDVQFMDYLNHYGGPYTIAFQTSPDGVTWTTGWSIVNPTGSYMSQTEHFTVKVNGASQLYIAFLFSGDSFNVNYWYIDNLVIQGRTGTMGAIQYSDWYCVDTIDPCQTQDFCFKDWTPATPWTPCSEQTYMVTLRTALCDPMDENPANDLYSTFVTVKFPADISVKITSPEKARNIAFASWVYPGYTMNTYDLLTPGTTTVLGPYTGSGFAAGGTWGPDDTWYVTDYYSAALMIADQTTGALTTIGGSGTAYNGIAYDFSTDTMYGASSYNLYTIDITTGAQTLVGSWGSSYLMIDIGIDNDGQIYGHDIVTDSMYLIDKNTGAATLLGSTGQSCNYAQGMEYDHDNGILYAAAYTSTGQEFTVDVATGFFTLVGAFASGAEVDGLAIPTTGGGGVNLPKPDIWIACGEQEICATITNEGVFAYVDDPSTPCEFEAIHVYWQLDKYTLTDPCKDPTVETVLTGEDTLELQCGESKEYCVNYDYDETGVYQLIFSAVADPDCDLDNNIDTFNVGVDCCDPITEHTLTPIIPDGQNNWYKQDVTVKITGYDPLCPDPCYGTSSGLAEIHYVINGVETVVKKDTATFKVKDEGVNLIKYWGVDVAGNIEDIFTFEIAIDKTAPTCDLIFQKVQDGTNAVEFTAIVFDATSGIDRVEFLANGEAQATKTAPPFMWNITWLDTYTEATQFKATVYDQAGNSAYDTVSGIKFAKVFASANTNNALSHSLPRAVTKGL